MAEIVDPKKGGARRFPETDWTNLDRLRQPAGALPIAPLDLLARKYWTPIYQYLRGKGYGEAEAQDLAQDFFMFAIRTQLFSKFDRERGRFRSFLLTSLSNFAANEWRRKTSQQRRPSGGFASLDELAEDTYLTPAALRQDQTPEILFHRAWIHEVVRNALHELEDSFTKSGKTTHFLLFRSRVVAPEIEDAMPPPLKEQARELRLDYKEAANQIVTAKRAFLRILVRELRTYSSSDEELASERAEVLRALRL